MMRELKVTKFDDALGVVLPREIVDRMKVVEGSSLFLVETADGGFALKTRNPDFDAQLKKILEIMARYPNTLEALSK